MHLFLLYINDLPNISNKLTFFLFADDTNIYLDDFDLKNLEKTMNLELKKLSEWLCINRLSLNISKTKFVLFHAINKPKTPVTILINKNAIDEVKYIKYLGVLIDSHLSFKYHINELSKKLSRGTGILYKLRDFVSVKILKDVYYAIVYPFLLYGIAIWGSATKATLSPLHILQKKIIRIPTFEDDLPVIPGPLTHTPPLFYKLGLLDIYDLYNFQLGQITYKAVNNIGHANTVVHRFKPITDLYNYPTAHSFSGIFYIDKFRTVNYGQKSFQNECQKFWSSTPNFIKISPSVDVFKKNLKKWLLKKYH